MARIITDYPQFFTATTLNWYGLLKPGKYKNIIIESLRFLVNNNQIKLNAFVIMINHLHLIWQMHPFQDAKDLQRDFLKFTAQTIKKDLRNCHPGILERFRVNSIDREYQFWKRNSLSVELRTHQVYLQKLDYIHWNPVRAGLCKFPEDYKYSSAYFYETGIDNWGFLSHYWD
jgi:REP element-mobilizing transposase RayT